ncbi:hypothetical protein HL658_25745 [Azospirillum sp. RWY-5-1]|uniref:Uncharacterized protein n=1 Tax=Azospirillum oleiclasticum TaxID=2735135 RepID=A0ABX2THM8_9PROT|nr:hypothetical protein [Azospirillum oleiclasticum]NYZ15959.1 hypothetical protein [Azospirillum oleiclasticum]NYZ23562.1 hypothetical protein [Azospirillum oleiclasticum]
MASEKRSADRKDLDTMTRDFLSKGGQIVRCPPGPSENVVTKHGSFRRRNTQNQNQNQAKPAETVAAAPVAPAKPDGEAG